MEVSTSCSALCALKEQPVKFQHISLSELKTTEIWYTVSFDRAHQAFEACQEHSKQAGRPNVQFGPAPELGSQLHEASPAPGAGRARPPC